MEKKEFISIGLMSGTSMDGVDASIIRSNGTDELVNILDRYYEFDKEIYEKLVKLRNLTNSSVPFDLIIEASTPSIDVPLIKPILINSFFSIIIFFY